MKIGLTMATGGDTRTYGIPIGLGYMAEVVERRIPTARVLISQDIKKIKDFNPKIVGISSVSSTVNHARQLADELTTTKNIVVLGGPHITALPNLLPPEFDFGLSGEGEYEFADFCHTESRGGPLAHYFDKWEASPIKDLDLLPFPRRTKNPRNPYEATIFTSRGCPYRCSFCASANVWPQFRTCSAVYFIKELQHILKQFPLTRSIYILDDLFIARKNRLREMVELLEKTGLNRKLTFHGFIKSSITDETTMKLLKRMPMRRVRFGLESASPRVLDILKGNSKVEDHIRCIELANKYGIACKASWMVGAPGETEEDLRMTLQFMHKWKGKLGTEGFYLATPLPGTPFWEIAKAKGIVQESHDFDWSRLNLDWRNPDFDLDKACYLNDDVLPLKDAIDIVNAEGTRKVKA